jgi:hypothetical protein
VRKAGGLYHSSAQHEAAGRQAAAAGVSTLCSVEAALSCVAAFSWSGLVLCWSWSSDWLVWVTAGAITIVFALLFLCFNLPYLLQALPAVCGGPSHAGA